MAPREPLRGGKLALATVVLSMANFMEVLDTTIANVSLPSIAGDLGVSPNQATWVITSYAIANGVAVLTTSWLARRLGQVRVFAAAVALFTVASFTCGLAGSLPMLLASRIVQGAVAGLMVPLSQSLLLANYPPQRRGMGMAIWSMTVTVAPVIGPILGGLITDSIGWPWIFFVNIPFGIAAAILTWSLLGDRESETARDPVDWVGFALVVVFVGALQVLLDRGNDLDWFSSGSIRALAAVAVSGLALFLAWELTHERPLVDLRLFAIPSYSVATAALALGFMVYFASVVLLPLWLQTQLGYTATWAGLAVAPTGVFAIVCAPIVGRNIQRIDARWIGTGAFALFAYLSFWRSEFTPEASFRVLVMPQVFQGIAVAAFFTPLITQALGTLRQDQVALGSGLLNFLRLTAASFGASLATTLWDRRQAQHQAVLTDRANPYDPAYAQWLDRLGEAGLSDDQAHAAAYHLLQREVATRSIDDIFWLSGWLFLAVIPVLWLAKRARPGGAA